MGFPRKASATSAAHLALRPASFIGAVLYRGPSEFDGSPIAVIASGFNGSDNRKTGAGMVQVYIIRADVDPSEASRTGADAGICGACPYRGEFDENGIMVPSTRACYVTLMHGPRVTYKAFRAGRYLDMTESSPDDVADLFAGRMVRLGAYGDPAAVPAQVWANVMRRAAGGTGYTHSWRLRPDLAAYCMASCDTACERIEARMMGFRVFRVATAEAWTRLAGEVLCPASEEAGKLATCETCKACGGHASKARADIMIPLHGTGAYAATRRQIVA